MYFYWVFFAVIAFAGLAMTVRDTLWNNILTFCYILLAGVIALGIYQPLTIFADELTGGEYTYLLDLLGLWGTFGVVVILLRVIGAFLSDTQVRFLPPVEKFAAPAVGLLCGLTLACFALATLHTSPFPKEAFGGTLVHERSELDPPSVMAGAPDLAFLAIASTALDASAMGNGSFSPQLWVMDYAQRRADFEEAAKARGFMGVVKRNESR